MMDHIRQRDWNSTRNLYDHFVDEKDIDNCVVERIIRNKFWDPMISSDEEDPPGPIDWERIFTKTSSKEGQYRLFVPGFRKSPPYPKLSALTKEEHRHCIKVLSAENEHIMPHEFVGKPRKADFKVFEEKNEIYVKEQQEYIEWAKHMWTTTNCIRALRPKPLVEVVYETEFKMKTHMMQSFPKSYALAAQIPLKAENHHCELILPQTDLIKVDISQLPKVCYPNIYEKGVSILTKCPLPEPCKQHSSNFKLPNETELSLLPLTEIHKELAQYSMENGGDFIASENAVKCLLETDRSWSLPLSVCEVIGPDGDKSNIVVMGSEFPEKKDPAPIRSYRAFRHLLLHAFTSRSSRTRTITDRSDCSTHMSLRSRQTSTSLTTNTTDKKRFVPRANKRVERDPHKAAVRYNRATRTVAEYQEATDSDDDDDRLEIDINDESQNALEIDDNDTPIDDLNSSILTDNQPRKILKARSRLSVDKKSVTENLEINVDRQKLKKSDGTSECETDSQVMTNDGAVTENLDTNHNNNGDSSHINGQEPSEIDLESSQTDPESTKMDSQSTDKEKAPRQSNALEEFEIELSHCVCKDTEFEKLSPRSYRNLQIKNHTTKEQLNIIVHCSHKLKNDSSCDLLLEPILEYQLEIGGTMQSAKKLESLALSMMLRKNAELANVHVDGSCGEVVSIETMDLRKLTARHGEFQPDIANTLYTTLNQLAGLLPGAYLLKHEPEHGVNALLYSRTFGSSGPGCVPLQAPHAALTPAEEARFVQTAPRLMPVLLPIHKYYRQLPLTFTFNACQLVQEKVKYTNGKKKTPPAGIQWPKKRGKKNKGKK